MGYVGRSPEARTPKIEPAVDPRCSDWYRKRCSFGCGCSVMTICGTGGGSWGGALRGVYSLDTESENQHVRL